MFETIRELGNLGLVAFARERDYARGHAAGGAPAAAWKDDAALHFDAAIDYAREGRPAPDTGGQLTTGQPRVLYV